MSSQAIGRSAAALCRAGWPMLLAALPLPALAGGLPADGGARLFSPVPAAETADWTPVGPSDIDDAFLDTDWSVTTTGSFINENGENHYQALVAPSISIIRPGIRSTLGLTGSAQFAKNDGGSVSVEQLNLRGTSTYDVDPGGTLTSNLGFSMSQENPNDPDVSSDVADTPVELSGTADSSLKQQFGRLDVTVKGNAGRAVYGSTTLTDGTSIDNTDDNNTQFGTGLRLGYALTPVFEVFGDAEASRTLFDAASTDVGASLNGTQYSLMAGVAANWGPDLSASASAGFGVNHFDDASLADIRAALYAANIAYKPAEDLTLTGDLTSVIAPPGPDGTGTAQVTYQATAGATYVVNDWLDWRASANWHATTYAATTETDDGYGFGVGADYIINRQTKLSADYGFGRDTISPGTPEDTQTISLGLTVQK